MPASITHRTRGSIQLDIDGRAIEIPGEAFLQGHGSPDFLAYPGDVLRWDDGEKLTNEAREQVLQALLAAAKERGLVIELEPYLPIPAG